MLRKILAVAIVLLAPAADAGAQFQYEVVQGFSSTGTGPRTPSGPLLETTDGSLYGTTPAGGTSGEGTVFQIRPDRSLNIRSLGPAPGGTSPYGGLLQTTDGTLYGTTAGGGTDSSGTFFTISPSGTFVSYPLPKVTNISGELRAALGPRTGPALGADGSVYAVVPGWSTISSNYYPGGVVRLTPQGNVTRLGLPRSDNSGPLAAAPDGFLYGTDRPNPIPGASAFRFRPGSALENVHDFTNDEAPFPTGLVLAPDGNFYGASAGLPGPRIGTVFRMTPSGSVTVLHRFAPAIEGMDPAALVVAGDGNLYGVTSQGGIYDAGTIFKVSLAGAFEVIYTFTGGADGGHPLAPLIQARDGSLYGTASTGGPDGGGVVFRIKSTLTLPAITLDLPAPNATVGTSFTIAGWTLDRGSLLGTGIDAVHVYAFPNPGSGAAPIFVGVAALGLNRPDVGAAFGSQFSTAGFGLTSPVLAPGPYLIAALGRSTVTGTFSALATRTVTVVAPQSLPAMALDVPASNASVTGQVLVAGWAFDAGAPSGTGVDTIHVWAVPVDGGAPIFVGVATYGTARPDVGAVFGSRFTASGFYLVGSLPAGRYTIAAFAWSTVAGGFNNARVATNVTVQ